MSAAPFVVALAGNPNVGKSTLFNALTGARQHVGNWPGKTVEKKEGWFSLSGRDVMIVDLPGTYSLAAYSMEEIIARDFILNEHPSMVLAVLDAGNLERNLYLVSQLMELDIPLILVLNMSDAAQARGVTIDAPALSQALGGVPVVETVGSRGAGLDELRSTISQTLPGLPQQQVPFSYAASIEAEIDALQTRIQADRELSCAYPARWLAIKLLEEDADIIARLERAKQQPLLAEARAAVERIITALEDDPETLMTDGRYQFIAGIVERTVTRPASHHETASDRADRIITHRFLGLPIFLLLMWLVFQITANVSAPLMDWVDGVITGPFARWIAALLAALGLSGTWFEALLLDGVIAGVGGVLVFVPLLMLLYIAIGLLEDSGYMARAALVMDRPMRAIGLQGKSFLPLVVGFGCTVPAIYATRTLESERDRRLTAFLSTFMSCGARLPVYVIFAAVFFGANAGTVIFALYLLGIAVALLTGLVFKYTVYRSQPPLPFVIELPPYRVPNARTIFSQMWERTRGFVRNAGTVILACSIVVWFLMAAPRSLDWSEFNAVEPADSFFGAASGAIAPVLAPAGFGNWEAAGALVTGFVAKEVIISTMSQIYGTSGTGEDAGDAETPTLLDDLGGIASSFGEAFILTAQEALNILPRTTNLLPGLALPEFNLTGAEDGEDAESTGLSAVLMQVFTPLSALAFMVFILLYIPCMSAVAAMRHEFSSRWSLYQISYTSALAWLGAVLVYQGGLLLGLGA